MNAKLDAKSRFGDVFKSSFIFVAAIVALVFGPLRAIAADADLYEAYQIGTEKESTNQFFMREVGKEEGKPVYCVNLHKERPPVKERLNSNTGKKEFPQYAKQDATSDFARYTDGDKSSLNSRLMFALWNGYPNDAMGLKDAGAIDNIQAFTSATQHAVWHITDGYDSPLASQNDTTAKIYKVLIGEAQEFDYFNTKIKPQKVPTELKLSVYEPLNNVPNEGYKQWQNLISTEFVNEVGESVKPKPVKPGEGEGEKFFEFSFKKLDMDNNVPVIGAGLKIQDQNKKAGVKTSLEGVGTNIHQWDTSDTAQKIWLKPGAYLLYETKIAGGYVLPDSGLKTPLNMLEVNDDGKVTLADTGSKYVKTENTAINVYNKRNAEVPKPNSAGKKKIRISKFAEGATAQELKNAELALYKGEYSQEVPGDIVAIKTWISGPVIDVELDEGSYTLVEKNAPEGFDKAENIVFKNESGKVFLKNGDRWSETTKLVPVDATPFRAYSDFNDESTSWKGTPFGKFYYIDHDKKNESVDGDEVIYCFNVNRKAPMESYDYGESVNAWDKVEPKFKAEYDQKSMKGYAHKPRIEDPLKFGEAIQRVIYAGYPKNAMKFGDELTPAAFRTITQLAIYNFSDSFGLEEIAKLNENEAHGFFGILKPENVKIKEAYEKLIQYAVSDSELPEDSRVPFYVTNNIEYQNFIGTWMNPQSVIPVVEMIDKVIVPQDKAKTASVVFSKVVAGQGDELKGASLKVVKGEKADGEVVKSWTSTGTPETFALEPGVYTLVEDQAPLGFMKAEAITFRVGFDKDHANGMVEIKAGDKWTLAKNSVVVMQDKAKTASVVFSKVVAGQGDELKGASLKVVKGEKADGEVVKSWTSTGTPETFALEPGVYTLVEDQAPLGFMKAEAITFRVGFDKDHANGMVEIKAGDKWTLAKNSVVVMQDEREKTPDTPTKPEEPKTPEAPKVVPSPKFEDSKKSGLARTGLDLGVAGMVATGLIAAGVLGLAARKRNKA
ncbi:Cna B domain protein [Arcanobacterium haemolyticum DSM 20595]|uniref:Cna B domain protein n=1 Tax=Arcanobacterium haemolyticum (strain ATCC 9345 / DSM 20595 / CCM 5947 / CCUG 17215 / LMG 16163 / NBRC 15585 / NCTC 8452 / 11018) TaxID=644284 RepID=D7BLE5_ARCHD|nr:Cys-Gln thioester bond-forming surface protein [Arcanobacterium haemolyticum]ADH93475.1 Cna B domain protein [Arcanobacterium haemolyticum DSM 20595]